MSGTQAAGGVEGVGSQVLGCVNNTIAVEMEDPSPLERLAEGEDVFVKIDLKSILIFTMQSIGSKTDPEFSTEICSDGSSKVSIKLDVSELNSVSGNRMSVSVVEGDPSFNESLAMRSAVMLAFKLLQDNHLVSIVDFSTRIAQRYQSCNIHELVDEGIAALQYILSRWESTLDTCQSFAVSLHGMEFNNNAAGQITDKGKVIEVLSAPLSDLLLRLDTKSSALKEELKDIEYLHSAYEKERLEKTQRLSTMVPLYRVFMPNKDILGYVLSFFGIEEAEFSSTPDFHDKAMATVFMKFPLMEKKQYSGPVMLTAIGETSVQSVENAAFKALVFLEKKMAVKVIDFNYPHRKKTLKRLKKSIELVSNIVDLATNLRMMWAKLNNAIQFHIGNFCLDAPSLFSGDFSEGQIEAYRCCCRGLVDVHNSSVIAVDSCAQHVLNLQKLKWKIFDLKSNLAI